MKKNLSLTNSLLLVAPLVASLNVGILPSSAAILAGDRIESANSQEIIARLDALNIDAANAAKLERKILRAEELFSIISGDTDKNPPLGEDKNSFWGNLSAGINDIFTSDSETKSTATLPVKASVNNVQLSGNNQALDSLPSSQDRDPAKELLKALNFADGSDKQNQQVPVRSYTGKVEPDEINPSPVAENKKLAPTAENQPVKVQTYTAAASSQIVNATTQPKLAQLAPGLQGDRDSLDVMQIAGGALGLGFFIWMLFHD